MKIKIGNRWVGDGEPVFTVAEISCNHLQKKTYALKLIEEAKKAGADAVKFQTYTPDTMTIKCDNDYFRIKGTIWEGKTLYDLYKEAYTPWDWFPQLKDKAKEEGLVFFSTPFDETAVDFLEKLKVPVYKIASFEINHIPLIRYIAKKKKPVILSTGVAELEDIKLALKTIRGEGNNQIALLKCTSAYPAPLNEMNLKTIADMRNRFKVIPGLSDHSMGIVAPVVAVALGAKIIEKHFILRRSDGGPDAKFSLEPHEFKNMVKNVRDAEQVIGDVTYKLSSGIKKHLFFRRSIFTTKPIKKGEKFTRNNIKVIRPGYGLHPKYYLKSLGKRAVIDLPYGMPLKLKHIK
ncbi:MAG: pseudaminic acid synthase [Candidatus Micrarchaeia archaeon]